MRVDDLTIFLRAVDKTKTVFDKLNKRMKGLGTVARFAARGVSSIAAAAVASFAAAAAQGASLVRGFQDMGLQIDLTTRQAQGLFQAINSAAPGAEIQGINEAVLSLKERFADATVAAGPLYGLIEDFGIDIDLGVDNASLQLANFLEEVGKLPDANAKIFALKEVLGDEDARPFFRTIQNTEKLNKLITDLRTNVDNLPDILTPEQIKGVQDAKDATAEFDMAWNKFSVQSYALIAPALAGISRFLSSIVGTLTDGVRWVSAFFGGFSTVEAADSIAGINSQIEALNKLLVAQRQELQSAQGLSILAGGGAKVAEAEKQIEKLTANIKELERARTALGNKPLLSFGGSGSTGGVSDEIKKQTKAFEKLKDTIFTTNIEFDQFNLSSIQKLQSNFFDDNIGSIETKLLESISKADITPEQRAALKTQALKRIEDLRLVAANAATEAIAQANNPNTALFQQAIYGAQGERSPTEVTDVLKDQAEKQVEAIKAAYSELPGVISSVFEAMKQDVGSYININESMTDAERKFAEQSNRINKKRFEDNKKFSYAQAVISAGVGISRALELPFPANLIAATKVAAVAYKQIAAIKNQEYGVSGSVPSVSGGSSAGTNTSTARGGNNIPDTNRGGGTINLFIDSEEQVFTANQLREIFDEFVRRDWFDEANIRSAA